MASYKHLPTYTHGQTPEVQHYVTESSVTTRQVLKGDDSGVVCLCFEKGMAMRIVTLLNKELGEQDRERPQEDTRQG